MMVTIFKPKYWNDDKTKPKYDIGDTVYIIIGSSMEMPNSIKDANKIKFSQIGFFAKGIVVGFYKLGSKEEYLGYKVKILKEFINKGWKHDNRFHHNWIRYGEFLYKKFKNKLHINGEYHDESSD